MRARRQFGVTVLGVAAIAMFLGGGGAARADLALTAAGTAQGFGLTNFITAVPNNGAVGPVGITFPSGGGVLVADYGNGNVLKFTDTNGQTAAAGVVGQNYGAGNPAGLATVGTHVYLARQGAGLVSEVNAAGAFVQSIVSINGATGIVANPANGHLFVSGFGPTQISNVDPIAKTFTVFPAAGGGGWDGLSINPAGTVLYTARTSDGHIVGYNTATGAIVFDSGFVPGGIDGTALGGGTLDGNIFANTNAGTVVEINLATLAQTVIATGGSRGDFVTVDPNDGSLLLTQTDRIVRLIPPAGGGFGPPPPPPAPVPEPSSLALLALGGAALAGWRRWRGRRQATA